MKKLTQYITGFIIAAVLAALLMSNAGCGGDATVAQSHSNSCEYDNCEYDNGNHCGNVCITKGCEKPKHNHGKKK